MTAPEDLEALATKLERAAARGDRDAARDALEAFASHLASARRAFPVLRPAELDEVTRRIVAAHARSGLSVGALRLGGLPQFPEDAARMAGLLPGAALDEEAAVDGERAPLFCLFADAQAGLRPLGPVVDATLGLGPGPASAIVGELARGLHGLGFLPPLLHRAVGDPIAWEEHATERLTVLATRLGAPAERALWAAAADHLEHDPGIRAELAPILATLFALAKLAGRPPSERLLAAIRD